MRIAESLYTNGYISYPRTDNTVYPETLDLRAQIEIFKEGPFREYANALLEKAELVPTRGKKKKPQTTHLSFLLPWQRKLTSKKRNGKFTSLWSGAFLQPLQDPAYGKPCA